MAPRGGARGGGRGGRGGAYSRAPGTVSIGGVELNWDLTGLKIDKRPAEKFPDQPPPQQPPPNDGEADTVKYYVDMRERIHEGPFYTILNDGMKNGLKRRANDPAPTEASLFNPFTDNQTYTSKYLKVRRRIPKLDTRPYATDLFPAELRSLLDDATSTTKATHNGGVADHRPHKKRKTLHVTQDTAASRIEKYMEAQGQRLKDIEERGGEEADEEAEEEEEEEQEKPDAVDEEDNWSAVSSDSEEADDDYNAERYFDNGDDDDIDEGDPYENTYE